MKKAMVVLSGGQDSTTSLYWAKTMFEDIEAVTFNYGQRHAAELDSARKVAILAHVKHEIIDVPGILKSRSPLTDQSAQLETYTDYESMDKIIGDRVELTFVPMRNAFFLTLAANAALYRNIYNLVTGVCQMDNANYPDCREGFVLLQQDTINSALGLKPGTFKIHTPLMHKNKAETVKLARDLPGCWDALAYSHTCYANKVPPCGVCHACTLRAHGFEEAGLPDPLVERFSTAA